MRTKCNCAICAGYEAGIHSMAVVHVTRTEVAYQRGQADTAQFMMGMFGILFVLITGVSSLAYIAFGM